MAHDEATPDEPAATVDRVRHAILTGDLAPGDRLVELQLTDRFEVGRAAIRSALVELEKEGLVDRTANRGATVRRVRLGEAIQITQARQALESLCAAQAASNATDPERDELRQIRGDMQAAADDDRSADYSHLNALLHRRLCEISRHDVAAELVVNLRHRAAHHQFRLALRPGRMSESLPQHEAIIGAVVDGDADAARRAMHDHLESVIETLSEWSDLGLIV
ncbi:MAG: GntR family transcriptional regulator [Acidimicrobiales bacterium]